MYDIVSTSGKREDDMDGVLTIHHHNVPTLKECRELRSYESYLVVYANTKKIVPSNDWLHYSEISNPYSYAHRMMIRANQEQGILTPYTVHVSWRVGGSHHIWAKSRMEAEDIVSELPLPSIETDFDGIDFSIDEVMESNDTSIC